MVLGNRDLAVLDTGRVRVVAPVLEVRVTRSPDAPDDCRSLPVGNAPEVADPLCRW